MLFVLQPFCNIDSRTGGSCTALHIAAIQGHLGIIEKLVGYGADLNATISSSGDTPLHLVLIKCGDVEFSSHTPEMKKAREGRREALPFFSPSPSSFNSIPPFSSFKLPPPPFTPLLPSLSSLGVGFKEKGEEKEETNKMKGGALAFVQRRGGRKGEGRRSYRGKRMEWRGERVGRKNAGRE